MSSLNNTAIRQIVSATVLCLIGVGLNYLTLPLIDPVEFVLSPAIIFVAIRRLNIIGAMVVALVVLGHISWLWDSYNNALLYALEALAYWKGVRRGWNVFYTDLVFWLLIGVPLAAFLTTSSGIPINALAGVILLKQPMNGILYILLANIILVLITITIERRRSQQHLKLDSFIKDVLLAVLLIPLFGIFFITKFAIERNTIDSTLAANESYVQLTKNRVNQFLSGYQKAIQSLALQLGDRELMDSEIRSSLLLRSHQIYDGFITMLIADSNGDLLASSPAHLIDKSQGVSDREYFTFAKEMLHPFISEAFRGRGFGADPIVAISAPIISDSNQFAGIVEGSLNLYNLDLLFVLPSDTLSEILVVDNTDKVIFATEGLNLSFLEKVSISAQIDPLYQEVVTINESPKTYTLGFDTADNGWSIYFLADRSLQVERLARGFLWLLAIGAISLVSLLAVSEWLSRKLNSPIEGLVKRFAALSLHSPQTIEKENYLFEEVQTIFDRLDSAQQKLAELHSAQQQALFAKVSAEQQSEAKTELLSKVSHELRTPLNAILGQVQLLMLEDLPETVQKQLQQAEQAGRFLVFLIEDLLMLSKSQIGEFNLSLKPCKLNDVVNAAIELFSVKLDEKKIKFSSDLTKTSGLVVNGDEFRLQQAFSNLISNAIKYNHFGGSVIVESRISSDESDVLVTVSDSGFGIPHEYQSKVFQPFNRLAHEHGTIEGSGIGLSLSEQLIKAMQGEIQFTSVEDVGSHFTIRLPIAASALENDRPQEEITAIDLSGQRVLYIEDNKTNFLILKAWLNKQGTTAVDNGVNAANGLQLAEQNPYDVIFLDLGLPDRSGFDIIDELKALQPSTPIIALTADGSEISRERADGLAVHQFLTKPIDFMLVAETLSSLKRTS